jgi:polyisoprenoid-binding protein YceI
MKKNALILSAIVIFLVSFRPIEPATWALDNMHSNLGFSVGYLMISEIAGTFRMKEATLTTTSDDFSDATVTMIADVKSINTDVEDRDKHLKTADFFDAEKYPDLVFKSTSFKKTGDKNYKITGDLSFHGITKSVTLDAIAKTGTHPMSKKPIAGFKVTGIIKRSDFEIAKETLPAFLSDEVNLTANVVFAKN